MKRERVGFRLRGIEPAGDLVWTVSAARKAYWTEAGRVGARAWDQSRARGLDRYGRPLAPISGLTRQDRRDDVNSVTGRRPYSPMGRAQAEAPPLTPARARSRTRSLLTYRVEKDGVSYYWQVDSHTGLDWGIILKRHATGFFQRFRNGRVGWVPSRDVIGFSEAETEHIRTVMDRWWARNRPRWESVARTLEQARNRPAKVGPGRRVYGPAGEIVPVTAHTGRAEHLPASQLYQFRGPQDLLQPFSGRIRIVPRNPPGGGAAHPAPKPRPKPNPPIPAAVRLPEPKRPAAEHPKIRPAAAPEPAAPTPALPRRRRAALPGVEASDPIPEEFRPLLPEEFQDAETFGDLARRSGGLSWWVRLGQSLWELFFGGVHASVD